MYRIWWWLSRLALGVAHWSHQLGMRLHDRGLRSMLGGKPAFVAVDVETGEAVDEFGGDTRQGDE